jgi:hypothetical protein
MKQLTYIITLLAATSTIIIGIKTMNNQVSAEALGLIFLTVSPYAYLVVMTRHVSKKASIIAVLTLSILVGGFGVWAFVDSMFIQTDAQAGMAFIVVPVYQWGFLLLATLPVYFLNKKKTF